MDDIRARLPKELRLVRNRLCGRRVVERRQFFNNLRKKRGQKRLQGKHLSDIRGLLGDKSAGPMLDTLDEGGRMITSSREIVEHSTTFFHEWHAKKEISFGFHDPAADTSRLLDDWEHFRFSHLSTGIPDDVLRVLWDSLRSPRDKLSTSPRHARFLATIDEPPSLAEFRRALRQSKRQSSAGMSGVTYNLMSLWPDKVISQVYDILCAIWSNKSSPPFWKWRWLVPIPKKPDNLTLSNLRPISLIEASRKIWINFFITKIKRYWSTDKVLCPSQHAFLMSKSTEGALLQFRNTVEEIEETRSDLFLSSWDIKRAFDRVPKSILALSWERLGVPAPIAHYLVGLDKGGTTVVRTPYTEKRFRRHGYNTFSKSKIRRHPSKRRLVQDKAMLAPL